MLSKYATSTYNVQLNKSPLSPPHPSPLSHIPWQRNLEASPWLRSTKVQSSRSPDPPNIPPGINARLAANYYCSRDARRAVQPPTVAASYKQIAGSPDTVTRLVGRRMGCRWFRANLSPLIMAPVLVWISCSDLHVCWEGANVWE